MSHITMFNRKSPMMSQGLTKDWDMEKTDPSLARMTQLVQSLAEIMKLGHFPAVDLIDERVTLSEGGVGAIGIGEASGEGRAVKAAMLAVQDLREQQRLITDRF